MFLLLFLCFAREDTIYPLKPGKKHYESLRIEYQNRTAEINFGDCSVLTRNEGEPFIDCDGQCGKIRVLSFNGIKRIWIQREEPFLVSVCDVEVPATTTIYLPEWGFMENKYSRGEILYTLSTIILTKPQRVYI